MPSDKIKIFKLQTLKMSKPTPSLIGEETDIPRRTRKVHFTASSSRAKGKPFRESSFTLTRCLSTNLP